jgi:hypothetical protein
MQFATRNHRLDRVFRDMAEQLSGFLVCEALQRIDGLTLWRGDNGGNDLGEKLRRLVAIDGHCSPPFFGGSGRCHHPRWSITPKRP